MRKAILAILLVLAMALPFAGCGEKPIDDPTKPVDASTAGIIETTTEEDITEETTIEETTTEEPVSEPETTTEAGETTTAAETTAAPGPLNLSKEEILKRYAQVTQMVKDRQPSYVEFMYQDTTNKSEFPQDMRNVIDTYFYKDGPDEISILFGAISTKQLKSAAKANTNPKPHPKGARVSGGKKDSNTWWFSTPMNDKGCLGEPKHLSDATSIKDLGGDRHEIKLVLAGAKNPKAGTEGMSTAPNSIAAFMEVMDIAYLFNTPGASLAASAAGIKINVSNSYLQYSGSTCTLIYDAKTMQCESLKMVGRSTLYLDGTVKGVNCAKPIKIESVYEFTQFDWNTAYPK